MSNTNDPIKMAREYLEEHFNEEIADIVEQHGAAAAAASVASMIPALGSTACFVAQTALVYTMYVRINRALGIKLSKNVMKSVASAVLGNIAANAGSAVLALVGGAILPFIPIAGGVASALLMAAVGYATVMISAMCYAKVLVALNRSGRRAENMSESDLQAALNREIRNGNVKEDMKRYAAAYRKGRKDGTFTGNESVVFED